MAMSTERRRSLFLWGGAGFSLFGLVLLFWGGWSWSHAQRSSHWPSAPGVVESSEVHLVQHSGGISYRPAVTYRYRVGGAWYRSSRYGYNVTVRNRSLEEAREIANRYPAGAEVTVYYDPEDPGDAVLEPGVEGSTLGCVALGLALLAVGVLLLRTWMSVPLPPMR